MPRTNEAIDTDLKVYPVRKSFSNGVERLMQLGWKRGVLCFISRSMHKLPRPLRERAGVRGCLQRLRVLKRSGENLDTDKINPFFLLDG